MINPKNEEGQREANRLKRLPAGGEGQTFKGGSKLPPYSGFFHAKIKSDENAILFSGWAYRFFLSQ